MTRIIFIFTTIFIQIIVISAKPRPLIFTEAQREKLQKGIEELARKVQTTLGNRGSKVSLDKFGPPKITKDGVTIAKEIELDDPLKIGKGLQSIISKLINMTDMTGDGTTVVKTSDLQFDPMVWNKGIPSFFTKLWKTSANYLPIKNESEMKTWLWWFAGEKLEEFIQNGLKKTDKAIKEEVAKVEAIASDKNIEDIINDV